MILDCRSDSAITTYWESRPQIEQKQPRRCFLLTHSTDMKHSQPLGKMFSVTNTGKGDCACLLNNPLAEVIGSLETTKYQAQALRTSYRRQTHRSWCNDNLEHRGPRAPRTPPSKPSLHTREGKGGKHNADSQNAFLKVGTTRRFRVSLLTAYVFHV